MQYAKVVYQPRHEAHLNKAGWAYQLFETAEGFGYYLFDEQGAQLLVQPTIRNSPAPGMTKREAEAEAVASIEALPSLLLGYRYELYQSEFGTGYRIYGVDGSPWIEQPFAPGTPGFAGMTREGALKFAVADVQRLSFKCH